MKLPDANLLLYAVNAAEPMHRAARQWLEASLSENESVAFDWTVLLAFLRISTRRAIFPRPLKLEEAFEIVHDWLAQPCSLVVHATVRHEAVLKDLLIPFGTGGNLVSDAHLAALAIEHGATLYSADTDFSRFPGLDWINPLQS